MTVDEAVALLTERGWLVMPPLEGRVMTATMCPGCGQNRVVDISGGFLPHHVEHDGVSGAVCDLGVAAAGAEPEPVEVDA